MFCSMMSAKCGLFAMKLLATPDGCWLLNANLLVNAKMCQKALGSCHQQGTTNDRSTALVVRHSPALSGGCPLGQGSLVGLLHAQVGLLHSLVLAEALRRVGQYDLPSLEHVATM